MRVPIHYTFSGSRGDQALLCLVERKYENALGTISKLTSNTTAVMLLFRLYDKAKRYC